MALYIRSYLFMVWSADGTFGHAELVSLHRTVKTLSEKWQNSYVRHFFKLRTGSYNNSIFESSTEGKFVRCAASCMCSSLVSPIPSSHATHTHTHTHTHIHTHTHTHTDTCTIVSPPIHSLFITALFIFLETVVVNKFPLLPLPLLLNWRHFSERTNCFS